MIVSKRTQMELDVLREIALCCACQLTYFSEDEINLLEACIVEECIDVDDMITIALPFFLYAEE